MSPQFLCLEGPRPPPAPPHRHIPTKTYRNPAETASLHHSHGSEAPGRDRELLPPSLSYPPPWHTNPPVPDAGPCPPWGQHRPQGLPWKAAGVHPGAEPQPTCGSRGLPMAAMPVKGGLNPRLERAAAAAEPVAPRSLISAGQGEAAGDMGGQPAPSSRERAAGLSSNRLDLGKQCIDCYALRRVLKTSLPGPFRKGAAEQGKPATPGWHPRPDFKEPSALAAAL